MKLKRIFALVLALVLTLSLFPTQALATETEDKPGVVKSILNLITGKAKTEYVCGLEEHTHGDGCRAAEPSCGQEVTEGHAHAESCYGAEKTKLICTLPTEGHTHTDACKKVFSCVKAENHVHTAEAGCYALVTQSLCEIPTGHVHSAEAGCCEAGTENLICQIPENHVHDETCPSAQTLSDSVTCTQEENHVHGEGCYTIGQENLCGKDEAAAHVHDPETCYDYPLTCTQEVTAGHTHSQDCYALTCTLAEHTHDETCLPQPCAECGEKEGHKETCSEYVCPECEEKGGHKGSCSQFEIPHCDCGSQEENLALHSDTCTWKLGLQSYAQTRTAQQLFDSWEDLTEAEQAYVLQYLDTADQTKGQELDALLGTVGQVVQLDGKEFTLPAMGKVSQPSEEKQMALYELLNPFTGFAMFSNAPEYHFYDLESEEAGKITVSGLLEDNEDKSVVVYHLLKDASEIADNLPYMELSGEEFAEENAAAKEYSGVDGRVYYETQIASIASNGDITFETNSYSTFIFQVTFEYNGLKFTMSGMSGMHLSDLLKELGSSYSADEVTYIEFSDPSLLDIRQEGDDYLLTSTAPFSTIEWLIIEFNDGYVMEIRVTDPPIYYYLSGTDWKMETYSHTYNGVEYQRAKTTIQNYGANGSIVQVYVRPGTAVSGVTGIAWPDVSWNADKATSGGYKHDGWEWQWDGKENLALIDPGITAYKKIDIKQVDNRGTYNGASVAGFTYTLRIHVIPDYKPTLLSEALQTSGLQDHLSIQTLPVSLFNFDAAQFNGTRAFQFKGVSQGVTATATTNLSGINSGGGSADMGIFKDTLNDAGLPVFALGDVDQTYVFDDTTPAGKKVYKNVPFEFIFDENTRTYYYSSLLNHAQLTEDGNGGHKVVLYKEGMSPTDFSIQHPNGLAEGTARSAQTYSGYYPFADINKAFLSTNANKFDWREWEKQLKIPYADMVSQKLAGNYMVKDLVTTSAVKAADGTGAVSTINMHYGYSVDGFFYLPEGRKLEGLDMEYSFTGDDDLWVFIDGKLVLDIGGGHTPVIGKFNLRTGKVSISSAQQLKGANEEGSVQTPYENTSDYLLGLEDNMMHRIQIFYLERMSGESNCYMRFNLPIIPEQTVTVTNDIVDQIGHNLSIELMDPHRYQLQITKSIAGKVTTSIGANEPYLLNGTTACKTDADGYFYLKHGEYALFSDIPRFYEGAHENDEPTYVVVTQDLDKSLMYAKVDTNVNGVPNVTEVTEHTDLKTITADKAEVPHTGNITVKFTNYIYADPMTIENVVVGGTDGLVKDGIHNEPEQEFQYMLSFQPEVMVHPDLNDPDYGIQNPDVDEVIGTDHHWMTINLKHGEKLVLQSVPRGVIFRLRAIDPDQATVSSFDDPSVTYTYTDQNGVEQGSVTQVLTYIGKGGEHSEDKSLFMEETLNHGSHHLKITNTQRGMIMIKHQGSEDVDPEQSFLYNIKGTNEHNKDVNVDVAILGNSTALIRGLIIGDYTVTQKEDWSWRYDLTTPAEQKVENWQFEQKAGDYGKQFVYEDARKEIYWLDGNSWCKNLFGAKITAENLGGK